MGFFGLRSGRIFSIYEEKKIQNHQIINFISLNNDNIFLLVDLNSNFFVDTSFMFLANDGIIRGHFY